MKTSADLHGSTSELSNWLRITQNNWARVNLGMRKPVARRMVQACAACAISTEERLAETWLVLGGRGAGKTRLGAEWVNSLVRGFPPFAERRHSQIALVGETLGDVREVMIEGPSGIVTISRHSRPRFEPSRRRLVWDSGAVAQIFSSEDPESLRGPQFEAAWCDELGNGRMPKRASTCCSSGCGWATGRARSSPRRPGRRS